MAARFEELDWQQTPMGEISLRRRLDPALRIDIYEVKLGDEFLMSSLFTVGETELARLALRALPGQGPLDVVVGGLGLGYTAQAVIADPRVSCMVVVDALSEVIGWHRRGLIPATAGLAANPRTRLRHGDFFALAQGDGFDPGTPGRRWHAVLVDIDHSPRHLLHADHASFYTSEGLRAMADRLHPGGVFALWSNDPPDPGFSRQLDEVFATSQAHVVTFPNPLQDRDATNTVYLATTASGPNP